MKRYQMMIGLTILAIAIVIAGVLVSNVIERAGNEVAGQIAGQSAFFLEKEGRLSHIDEINNEKTTYKAGSCLHFGMLAIKIFGRHEYHTKLRDYTLLGC